jgi:hypothetical protein
VPGLDAVVVVAPPALLAYGPAPGVELIPYFLGLLAWAGVAVGAVLLSPITALLRRLRRSRGAPPPAPPAAAPLAAPAEGNHDGPS